MKTTLIHAPELSDDLVAAWNALIADRPEFASPYYSPEYTRIVGSVRPDTHILALEDGGRFVGFFPHQSDRFGFGGSVGTILTDYQGLVGDALSLSARDLLRACGLSYFFFNHMPETQLIFLPYAYNTAYSPVMDVGEGLAAYLRLLNDGKDGTPNFVKQLEKRKKRRLEREVGPLRFEADVRDPELLRAMMRCKSAQYLQTGAEDIFAVPWIRETIERFFYSRTPGFSGILSALYAGDQLVATHMGMCSKGVWHWWFPCYDKAYASYSPGLVLLLEMAAVARERGIASIDLGRGDSLYKRRFMTSAVSLMEGVVSVPAVLAWGKRNSELAKSRLKASPLGDFIRAALARVRNLKRGGRRHAQQ